MIFIKLILRHNVYFYLSLYIVFVFCFIFGGWLSVFMIGSPQKVCNIKNANCLTSHRKVVQFA